MKPFDLEAAKRGEPVQANSKGTWTDAHFVGMSADGLIVLQGDFKNGLEFSRWSQDYVRMATKKRMVYLNVYASRYNVDKGQDPGNFSRTFDTEADARENGRKDCAVAIVIARPVEIEE